MLLLLSFSLLLGAPEQQPPTAEQLEAIEVIPDPAPPTARGADDELIFEPLLDPDDILSRDAADEDAAEPVIDHRDPAKPAAPSPVRASDAPTPLSKPATIEEQSRRRNVGELPPVKMTLTYFDLLLSPIREAPLLLPVDPLAPGREAVEVVDDTGKAGPKFKASQQKLLLGTTLSNRLDLRENQVLYKWRIEGGGSFRQGNNSNANLRGLAQTERHTNRTAFLAKISSSFNETGRVDNYKAGSDLLIDRTLRGRWIAFARNEAETDTAQLIRLRSLTSSGLGFRFIDELKCRWVMRTGPTFSWVDYDSSSGRDGEARSGWTIESEYRRVVWDSTRFEWTSRAFPDFDTDQSLRVRNEAAVLFPIGGKQGPLNWKIGIRHDYQSDPVRNARTSDVEGYFAISYLK